MIIIDSHQAPQLHLCRQGCVSLSPFSSLVLTLSSRLFSDLLPKWTLIIVYNASDDCGVFHILHNRVLMMSGSAVMGVHSVNSRGVSTQLWGAPVLSINIEVVLWGSPIFSMLFQFKCGTQVQSVNISNQPHGWHSIELKSTNKHSDVAVLRCVTTEGKAVDVASSVDLLVLRACYTMFLGLQVLESIHIATKPTEWHHWRRLIRLHVASSGPTLRLYSNYFKYAEVELPFEKAPCRAWIGVMQLFCRHGSTIH